MSVPAGLPSCRALSAVAEVMKVGAASVETPLRHENSTLCFLSLHLPAPSLIPRTIAQSIITPPTLLYYREEIIFSLHSMDHMISDVPHTSSCPEIYCNSFEVGLGLTLEPAVPAVSADALLSPLDFEEILDKCNSAALKDAAHIPLSLLKLHEQATQPSTTLLRRLYSFSPERSVPATTNLDAINETPELRAPVRSEICRRERGHSIGNEGSESCQNESVKRLKVPWVHEAPELDERISSKDKLQRFRKVHNNSMLLQDHANR